MTRRPAALLAVLALTGSLAACGGAEDDRSQVSSASSPVPVSSAPTPASTEAATPAASPSAVDTGSAEMVTEDPVGGPLTVTAVRVAPQDGYDRVVFELDGEQAGQPGWRVEYTDSPSAQGSGDPVEVSGDAVLAVIITGTGYPFDTGVEEVSGDPALPSGLQVVREVALGAVFEGQYEAFIGLTGERPFTVTRLADPARVVIDITHP